jgi:hypothetical protein
MLGQVKISVAMLDNMLRFGDLAFDVAQFETGQPQDFQAPPAENSHGNQVPILESFRPPNPKPLLWAARDIPAKPRVFRPEISRRGGWMAM